MNRIFVVWATFVLLGCTSDRPPGQGTAAPGADVSIAKGAEGGKPGARLVPAPISGADVATIVRKAVANEKAARRTLLVYVGASWCGPCSLFHQQVASGELDSQLSDATFLEFDIEVDKERLAAAGYTPNGFPFFARPGADGRASGRQESPIEKDAHADELLALVQALTAH